MASLVESVFYGFYGFGPYSTFTGGDVSSAVQTGHSGSSGLRGDVS